MNTKVYKYTLDAKWSHSLSDGLSYGSSSVDLPIDCRILHVGEQGGNIRLWAAVDPDRRCSRRKFNILPTGGRIPGNSTFIGTVQMEDGLVWHIFEEH